jgi:non-specific serine/threonine protein kinase
VAALFQLNDLVQSGFFQSAETVYDQKHTVLRLRTVSDGLLRVFTSQEILDKATAKARAREMKLVREQGDTLEGDVPDEGDVFRVIIRQNDERYFDTSCSCDEKQFPLCLHKATVFLQVLYERGVDHFHAMRNWDEQKSRLLSVYGYSLSDNLEGKFTFSYDENGKPSLRVLDPTIKRVQPVTPAITRLPVQAVLETVVVPRVDQRLGVILRPGVGPYPKLEWALVAATADEENGRLEGPLEPLELGQYVAAAAFQESDRDLIPSVRKLLADEVIKYLRKALPFGDFLTDVDSLKSSELSPEIREAIWEYLLPKYHRLLEKFADHPYCYLQEPGQSLSLRGLNQIALSATSARVHVFVKPTDEGSVTLSLKWEIEGVQVPFADARLLATGLLLYGEKLYALHSITEVLLVEAVPQGTRLISKRDWPGYLKNTVMKWAASVHVQFDPMFMEQTTGSRPQSRLYLLERDNTLVLRPALIYEGIEVAPGTGHELLLAHNARVQIIPRDPEAETALMTLLRNLHTDIRLAEGDRVFYLPASAVLSHNWFFRFLDAMREGAVELKGLEQLKSLRLNTHKPETKVQVSSGIDWFDASVELAYGDQVATLTDIKKALAAKQNFVRLADGTLGLLPDEWLQKYGLLVKMGEAKGGKLRLKRFHFGVIEQLLAEVDEEKVQVELQAKKERLAEIIDSDFSELPAPITLQAGLRPYQQAGFQWLVFLKEAGWGGILADDMGLGKTVQALAYFLHLKSLNPEAKFLVICPTTLVYNWESELQKFAPSLNHIIHHGTKRASNVSAFKASDVVITTYGTMRSDIKLLRECSFACAVLDESQAIKNPQSQVAKAALLLNADHRLALSGTPVQNNTFDLYSQLNFLNPGMLGSREFFMNEFATPIDKFSEEETKKQLKQLTYPFLLRRTKEQVAKDLPEKTEILLHCEMGAEQRRVYNSYRVAYKDRILGLIDEQGIEKSHLHILQGLTKLRQICDSPALLTEEASNPASAHSIKLDELTREIEENVGNHKALIFSQFLGMLGLIRQRLEKMGIPYVYFDGSSSATARKEAVEQFQTDQDCRVFLISLKAGGIGLNLTAADYVYLVDPWWNPAVEQQAIDRTHRIGQTKAIFAYRLICRDSIEEKMLLLQERKRALAADLVSDDGALLKRLTRDDIAFLLS